MSNNNASQQLNKYFYFNWKSQIAIYLKVVFKNLCMANFFNKMSQSNSTGAESLWNPSSSGSCRWEKSDFYQEQSRRLRNTIRAQPFVIPNTMLTVHNHLESEVKQQKINSLGIQQK